MQSSTIFLMACHGEIEKPDAAIFADTGWESKAVYGWFEKPKKHGERCGIPVYTVSNGDIRNDALRFQVNYNGPESKRQLQKGITAEGKVRWGSMPYFTLAQNGGKGMVRRQCTYEYKIRVLEKKQRELAGYRPYQRIPPGTVELWKGISTDEMQRAKMSPTRWIDFYYPLIDLRMSRSRCLQWCESRGYYPPRSACIGCPFRKNSEWRHMKDNFPGEWQDAVDFDYAIRKCGGMDSETFLHADRVPLDRVDLSVPDDFQEQLGFFKSECAGVCGV